MSNPIRSDEDRAKGAVEQDRPGQPTNESFRGQIGHRHKGPILDTHDTDFPEPGESPEHSGELMANSSGKKDKTSEDEQQRREREADPVQDEVDQDPGDQQKRNQSESSEDPLAA